MLLLAVDRDMYCPTIRRPYLCSVVNEMCTTMSFHDRESDSGIKWRDS